MAERLRKKTEHRVKVTGGLDYNLRIPGAQIKDLCQFVTLLEHAILHSHDKGSLARLTRHAARMKRKVEPF